MADIKLPGIEHQTNDRSAWDRTYEEFRRIEAEYDRLCDAEDDAAEAAGAECLREDRYFDEYKLGIGMSREAVVRQARYAVAVRDYKGQTGFTLYPPEKRREDEAKLERINIEAERVADEFMAYQERHFAARKACRVEELEAVARAYRPRYFEAREALMSLQAPDTEALLAKMEIAARSLDDEHADSTLADAKRLLAA